MEKAQKIKGKVVAAMFYPVAVLIVAVVILGVLMVIVIPKFKEVFAGMGEGRPLPAFTRFVMGISDAVAQQYHRHRRSSVAVVVIAFMLFIKTKFGRHVWDKFKLKMPVHRAGGQQGGHLPLHPHLGTLVSSGVPILAGADHRQGNRRQRHHRQRRRPPSTKASRKAKPSPPRSRPPACFRPWSSPWWTSASRPARCPEMMMKIADNYDEEVDNAVAAMTSLLEPIMIVFLAVIVGSIVIAMFLPLIDLMNGLGGERRRRQGIACQSPNLLAVSILPNPTQFCRAFRKNLLTTDHVHV